VNSGKIVAGDTGFQQRREFAIIGNPTHVAARLEAASEELNASLVASDTTYDAVRDLFVGVPTSSLPLRGLRRLQNAYIVRGLSRRASEDDLLTLPTQRSFAQTTVFANVPPEESNDLYIERESAAQREPERIEAPPPPPTHRIDERVQGIGAAETPRFSRLDDERPILPEPPPIIGTYEDDQGPPFALPP
jgi:hypothetical protein